jgi:hypothetical protein
MTTRFWMVLGGYGSEPTRRHATLPETQEEARRLCQKHGKEFIILEAIAIVRTTMPPVEVVELK